jgi:hypothetical protein
MMERCSWTIEESSSIFSSADQVISKGLSLELSIVTFTTRLLGFFDGIEQVKVSLFQVFYVSGALMLRFQRLYFFCLSLVGNLM